jgi:glucose/arabinose dehydrogenase
MNNLIAAACAILLVLTTAIVASPALALQQVADWPEVSLTPFVGGLDQPTYIVHAGDGSGRLFVVEQVGRIRIVENGALLPAPFLDIGERISCCGERGLLSVAFPPGYAAKGYFYVYYTDPQGDITVSRFRIGASPDQADPASEEVLLKIAHCEFPNHNGGLLAFGPDGYLYRPVR